MKITPSGLAMPQTQTLPTLRSSTEVATRAPQEDNFKPSNIHGIGARAIYGAALYGMPTMAGATMGPAGIFPAVALGAGIGAITHPDSLKDAAIFGLVGACAGGGLGYVGSLLANTPYAWIPVVVATAVGAGTQVLYSQLHEPA